MTELEKQEAIEYFENSWMSEYQGRMYDRAIQALENQDSDCISRKEAMEFFKDDVYVVNELKNLPSVNPQPKTDVFDKIRAEIASYKDDKLIHAERNEMIDIVLEIIDRHLKEVEE